MQDLTLRHSIRTLLRRSLPRTVVVLYLLGSGAGASTSLAIQSDERNDAARLNRLMVQSIAVGDLESGIAYGLELVDLFPRKSVLSYNVACLYARQGDPERALHWFQTAADRGFYYVSTVRRDEDLDLIREHGSFDAIIEQIKKNNAVELARIQPQLDRARLVTYLPTDHDPDKPVPLVVVLHGRGGHAREMADAFHKSVTGLGAILVAPQARTRLGDGFEWGVVEHTHYQIKSAIQRTKAVHRIDDKRIVVGGFSQGGSMALSFALEHPDLVCGVLCLAPHHDRELNPITPDVAKHSTRFFIMSGALDTTAPNNQALVRDLERIGVSVELRLYPGVGHSLPPRHDREFADGVRFVLQR